MKRRTLILACFVSGLLIITPALGQDIEDSPPIGSGTDSGTDSGAEPDGPIDTGSLGDFGDIKTASDFFDELSDNYGFIDDYQANVVFTYPDTTMSGVLYHKRPDMLLIEYEDPTDQIISADGVRLQVYIPYLDVVLEQVLPPHETDSGLGIASPQALGIMQSRYSVAYLDSQDLVPMDEFSDDMVRKLKLEWRNIGEGFREIILSVDTDMMIRRIEATTPSLDEFTIDFTDITVNQGLPSQMFVWDSPPSANLIRDFIFEPEDAE